MKVIVSLPVWWLCIIIVLSTQIAAFAAQPVMPALDAAGNIVIGNTYCKLLFTPDGRCAGFIDARSGLDYLVNNTAVSLAAITKGDKSYNATKAYLRQNDVVLEFGDAQVVVTLRPRAKDSYLTIEVVSLRGENVTRLTFLDMPLNLKAEFIEPFAACAMALNLQTDVPQIPGLNTKMTAYCYPRFGFEGAKLAIVGCEPSKMRDIMKQVVKDSPELLKTSIGGPWAWEAPINRGSYFLDTSGVTLANVDNWIALAKLFGFGEIDFNVSFRHGDFYPRKDLYPRGMADVKAIVKKLHAAGINAGLHTYAFFIDKASRYVTPVPDPRLGKAATFTLSESLSADAKSVPVIESTANVSALTGFFVQNSNTIQIDDELIIFSSATKEAPFTLTGCTRGAYGTKISTHPRGAKVHQLREEFGLLAPDADSTLLAEVAANTANAFNECGFDMLYLDALDGQGVLAGSENGWHYGSKFVFEMAKRLKRPALFEMSTFHHHLWYVRSRMGAWDVAFRDRKEAIDHHCEINQRLDKMFLPGNMGWWNIGFQPGWQSTQIERAFTDEIELLMCRCLAFNNGLSLLGIDTKNINTVPVLRAMAPIIRQYEQLRLSNSLPSSTINRLRKLGDEFTLEKGDQGKLRFRPVQYAKHKVSGLNNWSNVWTENNKFGRQPIKLRIEALYSVKSYNSPSAVVLDDFSNTSAFTSRGRRRNLFLRSDGTGMKVTGTLTTSTDQVKVGTASGLFQATNSDAESTEAKVSLWRDFSPELSFRPNSGLGVWIYGDGQGEMLRLRLASPGSWYYGSGDFYVPIDFTGWRYFELIEPDSIRSNNLTNSLYWQHIDSFSIWLEDVPKGKTVSCYISPIRVLPAVASTIRNPSVTIGGRTITFPVTIRTNCYLEFKSMNDCKLYAPDGKVLGKIRPVGEVPVIESGKNAVEFQCEGASGMSPRANVTVITASSETLPAQN